MGGEGLLVPVLVRVPGSKFKIRLIPTSLLLHSEFIEATGWTEYVRLYCTMLNVRTLKTNKTMDSVTANRLAGLEGHTQLLPNL
jgi:hypothetical protein